MLNYLFMTCLMLLSYGIVPRPAEVKASSGAFIFSSQTIFNVENQEQKAVATLFADLFTNAAGFTPQVTINGKRGDVIFITDNSLKSEAYTLHITRRKIRISAADSKGFFYALQSLRQLLPPQIERTSIVSGLQWKVPAMKIKDQPRFEYRGYMLDVSRYFLPKEHVLKVIDCIAMLKINTLHLHLIDDNGWRIEIKKYPLLTEVGAWRVDHTDVLFPDRVNARQGEKATNGGFYTQEDIKEIVAYASQRQIEVIPEIEMPAHSLSALASYPELACPVVDKYIGVVPGMGIGVGDIIYCAGNEKTFDFLEDVIDEVVELFPSKYLHLGGDEARKTYWEVCPLCRARMEAEHLEHVEDLQGYFMGRMSKYAQSKGKIVMGWDELTNSKLPENAVIFGWQGNGQAACKAAALGHKFVMTPARHLYLIRYQGPQWFEPNTYFGNITLKDVYDYEPVQKDWKPEYTDLLMGVQGSLWTEFCNKPVDIEYLTFPRIAALAEIAWIPKDTKEWGGFIKSLDNYVEHIEAKGVTVAKSMFNIQHTITSERGVLKVQLECIRPDMSIRYTLDGSEPANTSTLYTSPITLSTDVTIKCNTFANGERQGKTLILPLHWNKATTKNVSPSNLNTFLLTNGLRGSLKHTDFEWVNFGSNQPSSFTIDLSCKTDFKTIIIGILTNNGMGIHKPASITISISNDNTDYTVINKRMFTEKEIFTLGNYVDDVTFDLQPLSARYIKIAMEGPGTCPIYHVRKGQESRISIDEIIVK